MVQTENENEGSPPFIEKERILTAPARVASV